MPIDNLPAAVSPGEIARCAPPPQPVRVEPGDTVATLEARIRADRCGSSGPWLYPVDVAAGMMFLADRQARRLAARYP